MLARVLEFLRHVHRYLEIDIMAILDAVAHAVGNTETVTTAAVQKLRELNAEADTLSSERDALVAERDALKTQVADLAAEAAAAQALADRLTAANAALQAAVEQA